MRGKKAFFPFPLAHKISIFSKLKPRLIIMTKSRDFEEKKSVTPERCHKHYDWFFPLSSLLGCHGPLQSGLWSPGGPSSAPPTPLSSGWRGRVHCGSLGFLVRCLSHRVAVGTKGDRSQESQCEVWGPLLWGNEKTAASLPQGPGQSSTVQPQQRAGSVSEGISL